MAKENVKQDEERLESIESTLGKTEMFVENNKKTITTVVVVLVVIILAIFGVKKYYIEPRNEEAMNEIYHAQQYFNADDYATALNGDGNYPGFLDVINNYGGTKSGNLAKSYAGVCYLNLGDFENAIKYLSAYKGKDDIWQYEVTANIGDAYLELDNAAEAAIYYEKAARDAKNSFISPMNLLKAGYAYEMTGNYEKALEMYKMIQSEYPNSNEGFSIEKNIAYVEAKLGK